MPRSDVIAWNGTSAGWLGFEADERLCRRIEAATGVRAATSMLALNEVLAATGVKRFGLVTPYIAPVQDAGDESRAPQQLGINTSASRAWASRTTTPLPR